MGYILLLRAEWHEIAIQPLIIIYHADDSMSRAPVSKTGVHFTLDRLRMYG